MNILFDVGLFIVSLAVNSLLLGLVVTGGTAIAFQLIPNSLPRLRYTLAVGAFLIAAFVPVVVTLGSADEPQLSPTAITKADEVSAVASSGNKKATGLRSDSNHDQSLLSPRKSLLDDIALYIGASWLGILFSGLWFFVSIHLLIREIAGHRRLRNERRGWRLADYQQREWFFCPDNITLYFAEDGFFTTGFLSPAIVLPHHFPDNLSDLSIRGIVLHEIAHAKWRDACINSLLRFIHGFFWVNPALWFLTRVIRAEREAAADRSALVSLSNPDDAAEANADYATAIISIAKLSASSLRQKRLVAAIHFGSAINLENRINRILNGGSPPKSVRLSLGFAVFLTSVLALTIIPVASIPLTKVPAEIPPAEFSDTREFNDSALSQNAFRPGFQRNDDTKGSSLVHVPFNLVRGNTTPSSADNEKTKDQDGVKTSATPVIEQTEIKLNKTLVQTNSSAKPNSGLVYRGDSAEPVIRPAPSDINRDKRREDSGKPVIRVVVRPLIRLDYSR
jgi:beta-lactamase regulating signal transducer with metallopeptidase domain